jgi:hypothetical protein
MKTKTTLLTVNASSAKGGDPSMFISTPDVDRDGDIIEPEGLDAADYLKNPIVGYGHDMRSLPVGTTTRLEVLPRGVKASWRWLEGDPFADRVRRAFDAGMLRAASVGFLPLASEPLAGGGLRFTRWSMVEWSLVNVPSNASAVRYLKSLGLPTWEDEPVLADDVVIELADEDTFEVADIAAALVGLRGDASARHREPVYDVDVPTLRAAVGEVVRSAIREATAAGVKGAVDRLRGRVD